jgi:hypothetical protein
VFVLPSPACPTDQTIRKENLMRSFVVATFAAALLLVISSGAVFAGAPVGRDVIRFTGEDNNFCGTGQTVLLTARGEITWFEDQGFGHVSTIWTNPTNGASIVDSWAGGGKFELIDDGDGAYTIVTTRVGRPASLRIANGSLLLDDVGVVVIYDHFDADDNFLGEDVVIKAGPHPSLEVPNLWCDLATAALGL